MCSRFTISRARQELELLFGLPFGFDYVPRYNVAPTQRVPVVRVSATGRELVALRWGLVPEKATPGGAPFFINARSETAGAKMSFRAAAQSRRCLVVADGFIEWEPVAGTKQPHWFYLASGSAFGFAGLWEPAVARGKYPGDDTVAILTVAANPEVAPVHDRMPAILRAEQFEAWLNPSADWEAVRDLLQPLPPGTLTSHPISTVINRSSYDAAVGLKPVVVGLFD